MKKFRFREFQVYKDALVFQKEMKFLSREKFPKKEQFCLTSQLWRALDSIVLNIAEGTDRGTDKDFAHYLNISHTSLNESEKLANQITAFRKRLLENPLK